MTATASLDLRLGEVAYRVRASFLPGPNATVAEKLVEHVLYTVDLTDGAVLEQDCVYIVPLLERLRFVAISASNLDEFYSVRVAGLIGQERAGVAKLSSDGRTPARALAAIHTEALGLIEGQQSAWRELRGLLQPEFCRARRGGG